MAKTKKKNIKLKYFVSLVFAVVILLSGSPSWAIEYGGIGGRPAYPQPGNARSESIFIHTAEPGQIVSEGVKVINNSETTRTISVYSTDSVVSSGGAFACAQKVDAKENVGGWISLEKEMVTLRSLSSEVIPFTINVPQNAGVGEQSGCIVIQEMKDSSAGQNLNGLALSFRTAIRVSVTVPGDITKKLEITGFSKTKGEKGKIIFQPKVKNLGNVSVDADVEVRPKYFFGASVKGDDGKKIVLGGEYPILRGQESEWNMDMKSPFWGGLYQAILAVRYNADPKVDENITQDVIWTHLSVSPVWFFVWPSLPALAMEIIILLAILALLYFVIIVQKRKSWIKHSWIEHKVKSGDSVEHLVEHYHVAWKLFVKTNHLRPPYTLKVGETVKVPPKPEGKA
ncbi:LysM peptidoglycan-binding domain-containing protein [Candidatus Microgenomates bacterium]|nr:LysM peptidoglycan-binding domain-containing protein [Candidatus Microgenomates bacterium]